MRASRHCLLAAAALLLCAAALAAADVTPAAAAASEAESRPPVKELFTRRGLCDADAGCTPGGLTAVVATMGYATRQPQLTRIVQQ
jgi:hypothetical protein